MPAIEIKPGIYWIGVNDRTTDLFEGQWPIAQEGISYNSYLIRDEKKVLVDMTRNSKEGLLVDQIHGLIDPADLDYIVVNHMEPDHTGALQVLRQVAPQATFLCTEKALPMMQAFYGITENVRAVKDGEELVLGEKTLQFFPIPFVHWPETMATYEKSQRVLFSCDAFGGYGALRGGIFDDQYENVDFYIRESLRYYVNIIARVSRPVLMAINKLAPLEIQMVAPSHGLIWRKHPEQIIQLYQQWASYATEPGEPGITLVYASMYGNTERMMNTVAAGISQVGVPLAILDAARTHLSYILPYLWTRRGVMIGAPTYDGVLFPPVAQVLHIAAEKRILNKKVARFGSYSWSGGAQRSTEQLVEPLKWEWAGTLEFMGAPTAEELRKGEAFGREFAQAIQEGR